jgi:adenosylhomocysteine nucleosidase
MFSDVKIIVIFAIPEEYRIFMQYFPCKIFEKVHIDGVTVDLILPTRSISPGQYSKKLGIVCVNKMGNVSAAIAASQVLSTFDIRHIVNLGLAAGVSPDVQSLGDIVIAERVRYYETGKLAGHQFQPSAEYIDVRSDIVAELALSDFSTWPLGVSLSGRPRKVFFGTIASGDKVIADSNFVKALKSYDRKTVGIEMESYGIAAAAVGRKQKFLVIRGVCDFANRAKNDNGRLSAIEGAVRLFTETFERGYFDKPAHLTTEDKPELPSVFSLKSRTETLNGLANNYITKTISDQFDYRRSIISGIANKFTIGELRTFCIALRIDFDEIDGTTKSEKAASLLSYVERKNLMTPAELAAFVEKF